MSKYYERLSNVYENPNFKFLDSADQLFVSDCLDILIRKKTTGFDNFDSIVENLISKIERDLRGSIQW